jgi:hypothetical protein
VTLDGNANELPVGLRVTVQFLVEGKSVLSKLAQ